MVLKGERRARIPPQGTGPTMSRVIAVLACGFALAACSMSMPSLDYFRSGTGDRGAADRIRAAGRRRQDRVRRGLPHPLRTDGGLRRRHGGHLRAQRLPAHDRAGARGSRRPPAAEPGLCGTSARRTTSPSWQEEAGCREEESGRERGASRSDPEPGSRAGTCGDDARRLSLAATATPAIAGLSPLD